MGYVIVEKILEKKENKKCLRSLGKGTIVRTMNKNNGICRIP